MNADRPRPRSGLAGRDGGAAPSRLAADLGMAPNSIIGRLDALERRGFVRRTPSATDRRRVVVDLTGEGRTLSDLMRRVMLRAQQP